MLVTTSFGGSGALQQLQQPEPLAKDFVVDRPLGRFPGGKPLGLQPGEERQVVDQFIDLIDLRADDHQRGGAWAASAAAASAQDEPQTPSRVAAWPPFKLSTTSAKPSCRSRRPTSSSNRSDAAATVSALAIIQDEL